MNTPTNFTATGGIKLIDLTWNTVSGATSYIVYYGEDGNTFDSSATFLTSPGQLTSLLPDNLYYLYIVATDGSTVSSPSATITAVTTESVPDVPTIGSPTAVPLGAIIEWTDASRATGYMVSYGISGIYDSAFTTTDLSGLISELEYGVSYNFKVRAYNSGGYSSYSSVVYVTPLAAVASVPEFLYPIEVGKTVIKVRGSISSNSNTYRIYYSETSGDFDFYLDSSDNTYSIEYLTEGTAYKMKLVAYGIDSSAESVVIYQTTLATPVTQTSTGNTNSSNVTLIVETDTIYNYKQTYDAMTGRVWQFRSSQERLAYKQAQFRQFALK
jgi:hypothetical protein